MWVRKAVKGGDIRKSDALKPMLVVEAGVREKYMFSENNLQLQYSR